ncbi:N-terminal phage integrase SAM-like domain-containing protein [Kitasatospora sp. NPDC048540]|uniref:N-terminal phage integrase SAM-like domain-containing protein n=1 Tax=Kitasatospora sp. NPDC048540 TaxID=3155634 RepID=UPI0033E1C56B
MPPPHRRPRHGTWAFAVDTPPIDGRPRTVRRAGFTDELRARIAPRRFNEDLALCVVTDPRQRTAEYLRDWLDEKELRLKPTTMARYRAYVEQDLIPALGTIRLIDLTRQHLSAHVTTQLRKGRGRPGCWTSPRQPHDTDPARWQRLTTAVNEYIKARIQERLAALPSRKPPAPPTGDQQRPPRSVHRDTHTHAHRLPGHPHGRRPT